MAPHSVLLLLHLSDLLTTCSPPYPHNRPPPLCGPCMSERTIITCSLSLSGLQKGPAERGHVKKRQDSSKSFDIFRQFSRRAKNVNKKSPKRIFDTFRQFSCGTNFTAPFGGLSLCLSLFLSLCLLEEAVLTLLSLGADWRKRDAKVDHAHAWLTFLCPFLRIKCLVS